MTCGRRKSEKNLGWGGKKMATCDHVVGRGGGVKKKRLHAATWGGGGGGGSGQKQGPRGLWMAPYILSHFKNFCLQSEY